MSFTINELIEQYELILEEDPDEMPTSKLVIIAIWDVTGSDWVLHTTTGEVFNRNEYGDLLSKVTDDFKKIVHQQAFSYYKLNRSQYVESIGSSANDLNKKYNGITSSQLYELIEKCLNKHGLSMLNISDTHKQCASGNNMFFTNTLYLDELSDGKNKNVNNIPFQVGGKIKEDVLALTKDMSNLIGAEFKL
jgi:hypothetical protein